MERHGIDEIACNASTVLFAFIEKKGTIETCQLCRPVFEDGMHEVKNPHLFCLVTIDLLTYIMRIVGFSTKSTSLLTAWLKKKATEFQSKKNNFYRLFALGSTHQTH